MMLSRAPKPALAPFVHRIWVTEERGCAEPARELVLPNGYMHIALRLRGAPLRVFREVDSAVPSFEAQAVVGGVRAGFYVRDVSSAVRAVGAQLMPGCALPLLGAPADVLAHAHTPLEACWGPQELARVCDRLAGAHTPEELLASWERELMARLPPVRALHPAVAAALRALAVSADVAPVVQASGYSHRGFNNLFLAAVGVTPKSYARVHRFSTALRDVSARGGDSMAALALAAGYSDQSHFNRDFRAFAGMTPGQYRALAPEHPHHVALR